MNTFVERLRKLESSSASDDKAARDLLLKRGLTESELSSAEALLKSLEVAPKALEPVSPDATDVRAAEEGMWGWYLEWSTIARQAVHDRRLLRSLGFLTASGADVPANDPSEEDPIDTDFEDDLADPFATPSARAAENAVASL